MKNNDNAAFLRRTLLLDAAISGSFGLLLTFCAPMLSSLLHVPAPFLRSVGLSLLPFCALLVFLAYRGHIARGSVWSVIALNVLWVAASVLVLLTRFISPNALGVGFVLFQAAAVAVFAELQYVGLRKAVA
ncbi:MAG TPA: hypothetical protein VF111_01645 [Thermoanaerobaculia bacterium]